MGLGITPQALANDVYLVIEQEHPLLLATYRDISASGEGIPVEGIRIEGRGEPEVVDDMLMTGVRFATARGKGSLVKTRSRQQAELVVKIYELGGGGRNHFLPIAEEAIRVQIERIEELLSMRRTVVSELIQTRTSDPEIGRRAYDLVMARL